MICFNYFCKSHTGQNKIVETGEMYNISLLYDNPHSIGHEQAIWKCKIGHVNTLLLHYILTNSNILQYNNFKNHSH